MRAIAAALTLILTGCVHNGDLATPSGNTLLLTKEGLPQLGGGEPMKCPGNNDGEIQKSWANGEKLHKGKCGGGLMVGDWKAWYDNGAVEWAAHFDAGRIVGTFKSWYANDQERAAVAFIGGAPDGELKAWHQNGQLAMKGTYVGGKKNGCWETWHDNGQMASKGTYADDKQVLTWLRWTADGTRSKDKLGGEASHGQCLITL